MIPKKKSFLLTRLYHIKNNFLAAEMNGRHANNNVSWYPSYQKNSMLAKNICYTLSELDIFLAEEFLNVPKRAQLVPNLR